MSEVASFPAAVQAEFAEPDAPVDLRLGPVEDDADLGLREAPTPPMTGPSAGDEEEEVTVLSAVKAELKAKREEDSPPRQTGRWVVETHDGYEVVFSLGVKNRFVQDAMEAAANRKARRDRAGNINQRDVDEVRWLAMVLGNYNEAIYRQGKRLAVRPGVPLTFRDPEFFDLVDLDSTRAQVWEAVVAFYAEDGPLLTHGRALLDDAGIIRDRPAEAATDPTRRR